MKLDAIENAIKELELSETSVSNVQNLACLYICQEHLKKAVTAQSDASESELQDVLPAYRKYREIKIKYQFHEVSEEALIPTIKLLAQELEEFISTLYNSACTRKEKKYIESVITKLQNHFDSI